MNPSLVWGERRGGGGRFEVASPLGGPAILEGENLGDLSELERGNLPVDLDLAAGCERLAGALRSLRGELVDALRRETGFVPKDCREVIDGTIDYVRRYADHPSTSIEPRNDGIREARAMRLVDLSVGTVAAILPQNAFLTLALSCMLNALRAGNRVILRAPQGSALSASLLGRALERTPALAPWVSIAVCSARPFVDWFFKAPLPGLLHFFGSSRHAADLIARGFAAGKTVLVDGEGNAWAYVDRDYSASRAAELLVQGAMRYNGQTCTSINGALVHPDAFDEVFDRAKERVRSLKFGIGDEDEVGPLFDAAQAEWCLGQLRESGGEILAGGRCEGSLLSPTLVAHPSETSAFVREGLFGPGFWIAPGDAETFERRWTSNRFPLCAAILQASPDAERWARRLPNLARLVLDGDPSVEDPFEYWGGYPPSAQNPVSAWPAKYRRTLQIDAP